MQLVAITGEKGHGKGEVAASIARWVRDHDLVAVERGFADAGKLSVARIFWPDITLERALEWANRFKNMTAARVVIVEGSGGHGQEVASVTSRQLFQNALTEGGRQIHGDDVWIDILLPTRMFFDEDLPVGSQWWGSFMIGDEYADFGLVSDMRFDNEAERVKMLGGLVWRVTRPGQGARDDHDSEAGVSDDLIDETIINDKGLDELDQRVRTLCEVWFGPNPKERADELQRARPA